MSQTRAAGSDIGGLFRAIDARDATAFVGFLTDDAVFRFGSAPAVTGREAIRAAVEDFFDSIADLSHAIHNTLRDGDTLVCEGIVTYTRLDGSRIAIPFANVFEYAGDLVAEYKIYIDIAPLYAT